MRCVTNSIVVNGGIRVKFSNEINNDEFLDQLLTIKNPLLINVNRVVIANLTINVLSNKFNRYKIYGYFAHHRNKVRKLFFKFAVFSLCILSII